MGGKRKRARHDHEDRRSRRRSERHFPGPAADVGLNALAKHDDGRELGRDLRHAGLRYRRRRRGHSFVCLSHNGRRIDLRLDDCHELRVGTEDAPGTGTGRIAASWFSYTSFTVDVDLTDGLTHDLELYFLDWDNAKRVENVTVSNAATGAVLSNETMSSFMSGTYLDLTVSGNVLITVTAVSGTNAVLSGLFFDPPPAPPQTASATFVRGTRRR